MSLFGTSSPEPLPRPRPPHCPASPAGQPASALEPPERSGYTTPAPAPPQRATEWQEGAMRTIRQGSKGDEVRLLQERLDAQGFHVGAIDGDFGPRTDAAVEMYQSAHGLDPDGIVGPLTWNVLLAGEQVQVHDRFKAGERRDLIALIPDSAPPEVRSVLQAAIGVLGIREVPDGSNGGPDVLPISGGWYDAATVQRIGLPPWCALYVSHCLRLGYAGRTGMPWGPLGKRIGSAEGLEAWGYDRGVLIGNLERSEERVRAAMLPQHPDLSGAVFTVGKIWTGKPQSTAGNPARHTGIIIAAVWDADGRDAVCTTIEGNVHNGVRSLSRRLSKMRTVIGWRAA